MTLLIASRSRSKTSSHYPSCSETLHESSKKYTFRRKIINVQKSDASQIVFIRTVENSRFKLFAKNHDDGVKLRCADDLEKNICDKQHFQQCNFFYVNDLRLSNAQSIEQL